MALGSTYNNNDKKKYEKEYFSAYRMGNSESQVDSSRLTFSFWNKMLKISISPLKKIDENGFPVWDLDNKIDAYLNHTKALMFKECIEKVLSGEFNTSGVPTGSGIVTFSNGTEFGINGYCLVIRNLDSNSGNVLASIVYEFKSNYHYVIDNFDSGNNNFTKRFVKDIEITEFLNLLDSYSRSASSAEAYFVADALKFDISRTQTKLNSICEKLGIEFTDKTSTGTKSGGSFFANSNAGTVNNNYTNNFSAATADDIEAMM